MDDFDRFFGDLDHIDDSNKDSSWPCFAHSFFESESHDIACILANALSQEGRSVPGIFMGRAGGDQFRQVLLAPTASKGTVIWHDIRTLPLISYLSETLSCRVHWIFVLEEYALRGYVRFDSGKCEEQILDPERYWRMNVLSGDDLVRKGIRAYDDLASFLARIQPHYRPVDTMWDFVSWMDEERRKALLHQGSLFKGCLWYSRAQGTTEFKEIGDCSNYDTELLRRWFIAES